jgi:GTP-binding protein
MKMPIVAIVGRPNVGKSSLLNALAGKRISIVQDTPGVTRDRVAYALRVAAGPPSRPDWRFVELVDTGGYGFDDPDLSEQIRQQIELAIAKADLVLFIVDCQTGLSSGDQTIASMLRKLGVKVVLLANKADAPRADAALGEFARLGFGTPIGVSAIQSRNLDDIFAAIRKNIDLKSAPKNVAEPEMLLAIVGKRNAGKSTLVNAVSELYGQEADRVIVSEVPGTTRDSVDVRFEKDGKILTVIDTAGVRKKRQMMTHDIEFYSFHRAERSIRRADVVLMLMDGTEAISEPDKKLAAYIAEQFKPVLLVINKWDLAMGYAREQMLTAEGNKVVTNEELMKKFEEYVRHELRHLSYAPIAFITAKDSKNVQVVLDLAQHLHNQANARITTGQLNRAIKQVLAERTPSSPTGRRPKILYATQVEVNPPTIVLFVNNPDFLTESYRRFVVNRLRELLPYAEVPIKLLVRGKSGREVEGRVSVGATSSGKRPKRFDTLRKRGR